MALSSRVVVTSVRVDSICGCVTCLVELNGAPWRVIAIERCWRHDD